jgi:hypothetical protein
MMKAQEKLYKSFHSEFLVVLCSSIVLQYSAGCCKIPIQFEKRVYLSKPALNLLKTWFSREKPAKMS